MPLRDSRNIACIQPPPSHIIRRFSSIDRQHAMDLPAPFRKQATLSSPFQLSHMQTYVHNLQGDIIGIVDPADNLVVEYRYDAWGQSLSVTGSLKTSLGELNPFKYRGYGSRPSLTADEGVFWNGTSRITIDNSDGWINTLMEGIELY